MSSSQRRARKVVKGRSFSYDFPSNTFYEAKQMKREGVRLHGACLH